MSHPCPPDANPTPWAVEETPQLRIVDANGSTVAKLTTLDLPNARRIVACVNICRGIDMVDLESVRDGVAPAFELILLASKQRAQLLAALQKIGGFTLSQFMGPHDMALECGNVARAAIAAVEESSADGWIEWNGGECPVPDGAIICIRFRNGDECPAGDGRSLDWEHHGCSGDIVAYRIVQGSSS